VSTLRQTDVDWTPEDRAELLATSEEGADRLDALISNLLDMSRIQTGSLQPFLQPTAIDEVAPLAARSVDGGSCLDIEISDELPLVATDPGLLERALANLVSNAVRYSPPEAPPTLTARVAGNCLAIEVIDHGPGVALDQRHQMMQPFQQVGEQRAGGVGLGLAVANGLVEAMGGRLYAATTPGGGLTMVIELPLAASGSDFSTVTGASQ
jgi:two-component system sensor histidine kinase KdpD